MGVQEHSLVVCSKGLLKREAMRPARSSLDSADLSRAEALRDAVPPLSLVASTPRASAACRWFEVRTERRFTYHHGPCPPLSRNARGHAFGASKISLPNLKNLPQCCYNSTKGQGKCF